MIGTGKKHMIYFTFKVFKHWNRLMIEAVEKFKTRLDMILDNLL